MTKTKMRSRFNQGVKGRVFDARGLAVQALIQIWDEGAYANISVNQHLQQAQLKGPDRGLFTELVYGVTRTKNTLDWVLAHFLKKDLAKLTSPIRQILRLAVYQLMYLQRIPPRAAVHQAVEMAKAYGHQGVAGLVNGVLRNFLRQREKIIFPDPEKDPIGHIVLKYSHPAWLVDRWVSEFGAEATIALCQYNNSPAPLALRVNTLKTTKEELKVRLQERQIAVKESSYVPEGLLVEDWPGLEEMEEFRQGLFAMQDEGSMLVSHALAPAAGSLVIDACGAPGSKTTHLAQLMDNQGEILAFDIHPHKIKLIAAGCRRLGITIVRPQLGDARELARYVPDGADYILVDAPCSGLGVLGRRADARWRKEPSQLKTLPVLQGEILQAAAAVLRPAGVLVYSTCSLAAEENHQVVAAFLANNPDCQLEDLTPYLPMGLTSEADRKQAQRGMLQLLPQIHATDGFFMARLRKMKND